MRTFFMVMLPGIAAIIGVGILGLFALYLAGQATRVAHAYIEKVQVTTARLIQLEDFAKQTSTAIATIITADAAHTAAIPDEIMDQLYQLQADNPIPPKTKAKR